jgi:hypothetical protein
MDRLSLAERTQGSYRTQTSLRSFFAIKNLDRAAGWSLQSKIDPYTPQNYGFNCPARGNRPRACNLSVAPVRFGFPAAVSPAKPNHNRMGGRSFGRDHGTAASACVCTRRAPVSKSVRVGFDFRDKCWISKPLSAGLVARGPLGSLLPAVGKTPSCA